MSTQLERSKHVQVDLLRFGVWKTVWIEEAYAKQGTYVSLKEGDEWEDGWYVQNVYDFHISSVYIRDHALDHKALQKRIK